MADYGTVTTVATSATRLALTSVGVYAPAMMGLSQGTVTSLAARGGLLLVGAYGLAGTLQPAPCPDCPDCPPPARFSLALGATPLGLALGDADT